MAKQRKVSKESDIRFLTSDALNTMIKDFLKLKELPKKMTMHQKVVLACLIIMHPKMDLTKMVLFMTKLDPAGLILLGVNTYLKSISSQRRKDLNRMVAKVKANRFPI
jgi:hypothetical protein